jgi:hypothetical protein
MTNPTVTMTVRDANYMRGWNDGMTAARDSYTAMAEALTAQSEVLAFQHRAIFQEGIRHALEQAVVALRDRQRFADWCDTHDVNQAVLSTDRAHQRAAVYVTHQLAHLLAPEIQ